MYNTIWLGLSYQVVPLDLEILYGVLFYLYSFIVYVYEKEHPNDVTRTLFKLYVLDLCN